jgi:hypothetical protein
MTASRTSYAGQSMMRVVIVTRGILVGALWLAAFTPVRAAVPFQGGMRAAASALSDTIVVKKGGVPGWWGRRNCPPGQWKKGWC